MTSNDKSDCDHKDEVMEALDKIGAIGEQLNTILDRLNKLDSSKYPPKNIETNLANLKVSTAKLEDFETGARKDIEEFKKSCSFNGDNLKECKENVKKKLDEQNQRIASMERQSATKLMTSSQRISTLSHTPEEEISNSSLSLKIATKTQKKP